MSPGMAAAEAAAVRSTDIDDDAEAAGTQLHLVLTMLSRGGAEHYTKHWTGRRFSCFAEAEQQIRAAPVGRGWLHLWQRR